MKTDIEKLEEQMAELLAQKKILEQAEKANAETAKKVMKYIMGSTLLTKEETNEADVNFDHIDEGVNKMSQARTQVVVAHIMKLIDHTGTSGVIIRELGMRTKKTRAKSGDRRSATTVTSELITAYQGHRDSPHPSTGRPAGVGYAASQTGISYAQGVQIEKGNYQGLEGRTDRWVNAEPVAENAPVKDAS